MKLWMIIGLGAAGYVGYRLYKSRVAAVAPAPSSQLPLPAGVVPGASTGSQTPGAYQCTAFQDDPSAAAYGAPAAAAVCNPNQPYINQFGQGPFSSADAQARINAYNAQRATAGSAPQLPAGATPDAVTPPINSYYGTTDTGCPGFYSLADKSKCTKQPKAKKCQGTALFDFCHAGWKSKASADKIVAKLMA